MPAPSPHRRLSWWTGLVAAVLVLAGCSSAAPAALDTGTVASTSSAISASEPTSTEDSAPSSSPAAPTSAAPSSSPSSVSTPSASAAPPSQAPAPAPTTGPTLPASRPTVLEVPSIGVRSELLNLGQNPDGTIQVPDVDDPNSPAGWYNGSPTPGELGPSILLGHVDSRALGPGVFYDLDELQPGAEIRVTREDGSVALFQVDRVASYAKLDFPTLTVYGNLDHAGLRLITCGGVFDPAAGSYESNIIAFATFVGQV